ncbi:beta strand repeat-containing protein [Parasphingorhabdus sp.]|uniref:beta strand repeat-containing protein n=1 Tax=Parasphingorhabdus sp. TaxID=2709688 RepID=UPI0030038FE3
MSDFTNILLRFDGKVSIAAGSAPIKVSGSNGADTVAIERGVEVVLDGSFNRGNDVINFTGLATSYSIVRLGSSSVKVTDAQGTSVTIPVGSVGATLQFADASRELVGSSSGITLGNQSVTSATAPVAAGSGVVAPFAPNDDIGTLPGADSSSSNIMVLSQGATVVFGEETDPTIVRGSNGADSITIAEGTVVILDGSFNRGNDTLTFEGLAEDYVITKSGSSAVVITDAAGTSVTIPVGVNGMTVNFADDSRQLVGGADGLFLGDQQVTNTPTAIADGDGAQVVNFHTLTEAYTGGSEGTPPTFEVYWGYNPNGTENDNSTEGPSDGGIPLSELVAFVTTITGLDLAELGLIDDDGTGPFDNVTNLTISNATTLTGEVEDSSAGSSPVLEISFADGSTQQFNIEAQIGEQYFKFLNDLLFDSEGNSRLFMKEVDEGDSSEDPSLIPIVLTPTENNGGTVEGDRTSSSDDTIVAGRLELLHQAYIDGGAGYNTLEIDAKGTYAQPLELLNIQEIRVTDLPNFYTVGDSGSGDGYLENTEVTDADLPNPIGTGSDNSWIDLTRAGQLDLLVVSDQGNATASSGDLTIVGVRNGATLRLEGGFDSGDTTIQYADVDPDGLTVQLNVGDVTEAINILQNSAVLNIESEGVSNYLQEFFGGGRLTNLNISGTGRFAVDGDLDDSFEDDTPVVIDASANSGGVDLRLTGSQNVMVAGSSGDDRFSITTSDDDGGPINDETVTITGGEGNNYYQVDGAEVVTITNGDGNNNYEVFAGPSGPGLPAVGQVTITTGNGDNKFELDTVATAVVTAGDGNNRVEITSQDSFDYTDPSQTPDWLSDLKIDLGDGNNKIYVTASSDFVGSSAVVDINVGTGNNEIAASGRTVDISTAGAGPNTIYALGEAITINNAASSGSTIVLGGSGNDFGMMINELGGNSPTGIPLNLDDNFLEPTVLLNVQAGSGATVVLGLEQGQVTLTALPGSVISGQDLTLDVRTVADMRAADLNGVTGVVLDDDNFTIGQSTTANNAVAGGNASVLIVTDEQFAEIGAENFSVDGAIFNTHSFVKIIVTESTSLTALGVDDLPRNIDLILEIQDGVTLSMTAEQLHTRVAQNGVTLANDGNTDVANGNVVITGGGINFDPFNTSDTVQTDIGGVVYYGGSLSSDFGAPGAYFNVNVNSVFGGYDRPADAPAEVVLTIDSNVTPIVGGFTTFHSNLEIVGDDDISFTGPINLGVTSGTGGPNAVPFIIDFSALDGEVVNFVVDGFERLAQGGGIYGNSDAGYDAEVLISIAADDNAPPGWDAANQDPLVSQGVSQYTVVTIDGPTAPGAPGSTATIVLCDSVEDLEVFALRGNYNDTLVVVDAAWGLDFELQGGGTAKAEGPTGTSNVGILDASYQWAGAEAVVTIVHANAGDTRPIHVEGISINNAISIEIVAPEGNVVIENIDGNDGNGDDYVESLTLTGSGDVTVVDDLPVTLESIDASGVVGDASFSVNDPTANGITIVGAQGGSTISLNDVEAGDIASISGAGPVTLVIGEDDADLSSTDLTNVTGVVLEGGAELTLTLEQADAIGADNFSAPDGNGSLVLEDLGEQPFAIANYGPGITVAVVSIVDQPEVTLNPATDLTGIGSLMVPEGVTLNLTAAQFQQLTGDGTITIIDTDGNAGNDAINVNITDLAQADVTPGFVVTGVDVGGGELTITLAESVVFTSTAANIFEGVNGEKATINIGDGLKLTLAEITQIDEMDINGGAGSTVEFTDVTGFLVNVDASGLDVDFLRLPALLVSGNNVDFMFEDLSARVEKVIYEGIGTVEGRAQLVTVEEGTTIFGDISFNDYLLGTEVTDLVVDLQGGTLIDGNLIFSTVQVNDQNGNGTFDGTDTVELVPTYLQQLTINSSGTAANTINGDTVNVIDGDVTPGAFGPAVGIGSRDNQLKSVTINATQALEILGEIIFSSHGSDPEGTLNNEPNDGITANNDNAAIATLVVNGDSDVTIGGLDTSDGDIDGLNVVNNGTGTLFATLSSAQIDATDALSFTGGDTQLTIEGPVDLSDDAIPAVSQITINDGATLTLTQAQLTAIGAENINDGETNGNANLVITEVGSDPFDAGDLDPDIGLAIVLEDDDVVLNGDFTGVTSLSVAEGTTLTLTAQQFQQLAGNGTITSYDTDGDNGDGNPYNLVITGLTQADVDAGFSLEDVVGAADVNITLGEASVDLGTFGDDGALEVGSASDIDTDDGVQADFILTNGQSLGLVNAGQADGLTVDGTGTTTVSYLYTPYSVITPVDASGLDVTFLRALASNFTAIASNVEVTIDDLASSVTLVLFETPDMMGFLDPTFRVVIVEEGITTPAGLIFNDADIGDEVRTLDLTLEGDVTINGDLSVPSRDNKDAGSIQVFFQQMTIRSEGDEVNTIAGDVDTVSALAPLFSINENNLLAIDIIANQDFVITGDVIFNAVGNDAVGAGGHPDYTGNFQDQVATLTITGASNVTIGALDTSDADITGLVLDLTGFTGVLDPDYNADNTETWTITNDNVDAGTAIFQDVNDGGSGDDAELSEIDASDFDGDLTIEDLQDVDDGDFTFTSGSGVNNVTLSDSGLDNLGADNLPGGMGLNADTAGWTYDFSDADVGSEFHLNNDLSLADPGSTLNIFLGDNTTLFIDQTMDLSNLDLTITGNPPTLVVADGATLTLSAAQADGLVIEGESGAASTGVVNIVNLGDDPVDLSGISADVAGTATLEDDDVTLDPTTDLGDFSITLDSIDNLSTSLAGQTIRFTTVDQADAREIIVNETANGGLDDNDSSTNVVFLFDDITAPIDTGDYDGAIGRLWVTPELINNEGGDVEQLFTTLPSTILRVEFSSLAELDVLFNSNSVDRIVEFVHFTDLNDLTFNDVGGSPDEFIRSLDLRFGGEVTIGDVDVSNVIVGANIDPDSVYFNGITLNSFRAVGRESTTVGETLAATDYRNDNDGANEVVSGPDNENVAPDAPNVVGDISGDDTNDQIDLLDVTINTQLDRDNNIPIGGQTVGIDLNGIDNTRGEAIEIGTITFDSSGVAPTALGATHTDPTTANLNITGENDVTIAAIDTSDADIVNLVMDLTGFTAVLDPVLLVDNTETVTITNGNSLLGEAIFQDVQGNELSVFDADDFDGTLTVNLSEIDSSNEDRTVVPDGDTTDPEDEAFTFTSGAGTTVVTLAAVGANTPTLDADSGWTFDFDDTDGAFNGGASQLIIDETVVFAADSNLTLIDASTYITGDVDLSEVNLTLTNNSGDDDMRIYVEAGNSLTISVQQALDLALGDVEIVGEGTVVLVGDATDVDGAVLGANLKTAVVDASAVTIVTAAGPGQDATLAFELTLTGALALNGTTAIGQTVIGSDFDDVLTIEPFPTDATLDYSYFGGLGDDTYLGVPGFGGDRIYNVDAGIDTIPFLYTGNIADPENDPATLNGTLIVSAGATANASVYAGPGFAATSETSNAGVANITDTSGSPVTIDLSLAGGPNGYNITGSGNDVLIGSDFVDTINGGNNFTAVGGAFDSLTGGGAGDTFVFDVQISAASSFVQTVTQAGIDREEIDFTGIADGTGDNDVDADEFVQVTYTRNNGAPIVVTVSDGTYGSDIDFSNAASVANAVADMLDNQAGVAATVLAGNVVSFTGDSGAGVTITGVTFGGDVTTPPTSVAYGGTFFGDALVLEDQAQITEVEIVGPPSAGDVYSLTTDFASGGNVLSSYTAGTAPNPALTPEAVATGLESNYVDGELTGVVLGAPDDNIIEFTDTDADNGGFSVSVDANAAFAGSGASSILDGDDEDFTSADIIFDFDGVGEGDEVSFGLGAGNGSNYDEAAEVADYATAYANANIEFAASGGSLMYYFTSATDLDGNPTTNLVGGDEGAGLLFVDANTDGQADMVVVILNNTEDTFSAGMIA